MDFFCKLLAEQPFTGVLQKRFSQKFIKIHGKASALESLFNKVAQPAALLKRRDSGAGLFLQFLIDFQEHFFFIDYPERTVSSLCKIQYIDIRFHSLVKRGWTVFSFNWKNKGIKK